MKKNVVANMDRSVEREVARIDKAKKKREARNLVLDFYKKSLFLNKNFKEDVAAGNGTTEVSVDMTSHVLVPLTWAKYFLRSAGSNFQLISTVLSCLSRIPR